MPDIDPVSFDPEAFPKAAEGPPPSTATLAPACCSNQPTGVRYDPDDPSTWADGTKAEADLDKIWPNGTRLRVHFINDGTPWGQKVRAAVERIAPTWADYANLSFDFGPQTTAHIVINLAPVADPRTGRALYQYWSVYGKDALGSIGQNQPSMSLAYSPDMDANAQFLESEFLRVIPHEFGHAIGLIHEHIRPDRPIVWDEPRVLAVYKAYPNYWDEDTIRSNILSFYQPAGGLSRLKGTAFDLDSIMMYAYPLGDDGQPLAHYNDAARTPFVSRNNYALSPLDKVLANMVYPATGVTDPDEGVLVPDDPATAGSIQQAGQVARYRFRPSAAGTIGIVATGEPSLVSLLSTRKEPAGRMLAFESPAKDRLQFNATRPGEDYFLEVRNARPMTGTGDFTIAVTTQA